MSHRLISRMQYPQLFSARHSFQIETFHQITPDTIRTTMSQNTIGGPLSFFTYGSLGETGRFLSTMAFLT